MTYFPRILRLSDANLVFLVAVPTDRFLCKSKLLDDTLYNSFVHERSHVGCSSQRLSKFVSLLFDCIQTREFRSGKL